MENIFWVYKIVGGFKFEPQVIDSDDGKHSKHISQTVDYTAKLITGQEDQR